MTQVAGLPASAAVRIYDLLVREAGAPDDEHSREMFVQSLVRGTREYRFMGSLGFGGKFWTDHGWYVTAYPEDMTPRRREIIARINTLLEDLRLRLESETAT